MNLNSTKFFFQTQEFVEFANEEVITISETYGKTTIEIHFCCQHNKVISIMKGSFGSIHSSGSASENEIKFFISTMLEKLKSLDVNEIIIKSFPACYSPSQFQLINTCYEDSGFSIKYTEISQFLNLSRSFIDSINPDERRYINYAKKHNFQFQTQDKEMLPEAYSLIKASRLDKAYPITMSLVELKESFNRFPENYLLFGVRHEEKLVATAVCVHINNEVIYTFFLGDNLSYRKHSPMVYLIQELHAWSKKNDYKILDLGISTEHGKINQGLFNFKKNLGAITSNKPIYSKLLG